MNNVVNFILESGISISLLAMIYFLFLRRETFFRLNRFFLIGSLFFSIPKLRLLLTETWLKPLPFTGTTCR